MKYFLLYGICVLLHQLVWSSEEYDLEKIFQLSKKAFRSNDVKENDKVLRKFYFSSDKKTSIWYHAIEEWRNLHARTLNSEDLKGLQRMIERADRTYDDCYAMKEGQAKAECFHGFHDILKAANHDLSWNFITGLSQDEGRAKYGIFFVCYTAMTVHISMVALYNAQFYKHDKDAKKLTEEFLDLNHFNKNTINRYEKELRISRADKVTPVTICDVRYKFWKEFEGACETRWRRSINEDNEGQDDNKNDETQPEFIKKSKWYEKSSDEENEEDNEDESSGNEGSNESDITDMEEETEDFDGQLHGDDPDLDIVDQLGNPVARNKIRFHATVIDEAHKTTIFDKYKEGRVEERADTMQALYKEGVKKRGKYMKRLVEKLEKFDNATVVQAREMNDFLCNHLELEKSA